MAASKQEIKKWFDQGVEQGAAFMVVRCDTFDWDDYPSYHDTEGSARGVVQSPGQMQKVMEVYDLSKPRDEQIAMPRCNALT